jgi:hypothetical protein
MAASLAINETVFFRFLVVEIARTGLRLQVNPSHGQSTKAFFESAQVAAERFATQIETISSGNVPRGARHRPWRVYPDIWFLCLRIASALLLVVAILWEHDDDYYTIMRWALLLTGAYGGYFFGYVSRSGWVWFFGLLGLFFNPILPTQLDRSVWQVVDGLVAVGLTMSVALAPGRKLLDPGSTGQRTLWGARHDHGGEDGGRA